MTSLYNFTLGQEDEDDPYSPFAMFKRTFVPQPVPIEPDPITQMEQFEVQQQPYFAPQNAIEPTAGAVAGATAEPYFGEPPPLPPPDVAVAPTLEPPGYEPVLPDYVSPAVAEPFYGTPEPLPMPDIVPPEPSTGGGLLGGIQNFLGGAADIALDAATLPFGGGGQQPQGLPYQDLPGAALNLYNTDIPYYSDFARNTLIPAAGEVYERAPVTGAIAGGIAALSDLTGIGNVSAGDVAQGIANVTTPVSAGDVALELTPFGTAGDVGRAVRGAGMGVLAAPGRIFPAGGMDDLADELASLTARINAGAATPQDMARAQELLSMQETLVPSQPFTPQPLTPDVAQSTALRESYDRGEFISPTLRGTPEPVTPESVQGFDQPLGPEDLRARLREMAAGAPRVQQQQAPGGVSAGPVGETTGAAPAAPSGPGAGTTAGVVSPPPPGPPATIPPPNVPKPPGWPDYLHELWINGILSGPKTHILNAVSNTVMGLMSPVERGLAAGVEQGLARIQGRPVERFFAEVPAEVYGAAKGLPEGVRAALSTIRNGISPAQATKWEVPRQAFPGAPGRLVRGPTTMLEAADAFNFAVNQQAALNASIVRQAKREGLRGQALTDRIAELTDNPTEDLIKAAASQADYRIFRAPPGEITQAFLDLREKVPGARFIIPFLRTPSNILKMGIERSPAAFLNVFDGGMWKNIAARNPEASDQISRAVIGSSIAGAFGAAYAEGKVDFTTAAPTNQAERDRFYREGKLPFAVKLPGVGWVQYNRIEPLNQTLVQVATTIDAVKNRKNPEQAAAQAIQTIANNLGSQTYLSGLDDFLTALDDPAVAGTRYAQRIAEGFIPYSAALRTAGQIMDPTYRDPEGVLERVQTNLPFLSENVPPRLNAFGEEVERPTPFSPVAISGAQQNAVDAELERLGMEVGFTGESISGYGLNRELSQLYQQSAGQFTYYALSAITGAEAYQGLTDEQKLKVMQRAVDESRNFVREPFGELVKTEAFKQLPPEQQNQVLAALLQDAASRAGEMVSR